jgi:alkanesulfonate monooxygenase SsuD/methylene tetrahydromethanopterin reductase-like flavin-dependent oxidoreductase (luciferase family)
MARQVIIADSDKEAVAQAKVIMARLAEGVERMFSAPSPHGDKGPTYTREFLGVSAEDPDAFIESAMIVGSPDTVTRKL